METIDLSIGHPEDAMLPLEKLKVAAMHRLSQKDKSCLQYGPEEGSPSFRERLSDFLTTQYGAKVSPNNLLITAGASHGLDLILSQFSQPGDTIFVEDPTYYFALSILRDRKLRIVPVLTDDNGINTDWLEEKLKTDRPRLLYTIPTFHNPTGTTLSIVRRKHLMQLAEEYNFLVIADEVYQLLGKNNEIPLPLSTFNPNRVMSLGSFSKILGPGLRLGWIQCLPEYITALVKNGVLQSGGGINLFTAAIVESAIELGIQDEYLSIARNIYNKRRLFMLSVLKDELPIGVNFTEPKGGFFVWLKLPQTINTIDLHKKALKMNIDFKPGEFFSCEGNFRNYLRLCFTFYDEPRLQLACQKLCRLLKNSM